MMQHGVVDDKPQEAFPDAYSARCTGGGGFGFGQSQPAQSPFGGTAAPFGQTSAPFGQQQVINTQHTGSFGGPDIVLEEGREHSALVLPTVQASSPFGAGSSPAMFGASQPVSSSPRITSCKSFSPFMHILVPWSSHPLTSQAFGAQSTPAFGVSSTPAFGTGGFGVRIPTLWSTLAKSPLDHCPSVNVNA